MHDVEKSKAQLLAELTALRQRVAILEAADLEGRQLDTALRQQHDASPIMSDAGPICMTDQDMTERECAEEALQESEARFRNLIEGSIQGILIHRDDTALFVNQAYADIFGYETPDDILRMSSLLPLIAPHERDRLNRYRADRLTGKEVPPHYEYQGVRQDGTLVWLDMRVRVVIWHGAPAVQSTVVDITERKQVEEALWVSEENYRTIFNAANDGIVVHDMQTNAFLEVNEKYVEMFGYSLEELRQITVETVSADEAPYTQAEAFRRLRKAVAEGPQIFEWRCHTKAGKPFWVEVNLKRTVISGEERLLAVIRDITERKRAEEERYHLEKQLRQSQKMEALGTLAGGIAHEFNNILSVMLGFTEIATYDLPLTHPASHGLHEVLSAGQRAKDLVQQILTFSRQSDLERRPVQCSLLVQEGLKLLRASLPTTIAIRQHIAGETGTILADPTQIHQILMNLCSNAEYAMRETGGLLEFRVVPVEVDVAFAAQHPVLRPGPYVRVTVRDTGPGIASEVLPRIFDPFFTTKGIGEGTGMGLAIVHGIVTSHGGAITVESTPGAGTTFSIYLPQLTDVAPAATSAPEADIRQGKGRILFVDDEERLACVGEELLERLGYDVVACTSSAAALEAFQVAPHRFDVVITDQTMPGMTGMTLGQELRHIRPDIPIILCTGFSHLVHAEKALAIGMDAFCMKPLVAQELAMTIQEVLGKRAQQGT